jgi:hypothetical protein
MSNEHIIQTNGDVTCIIRRTKEGKTHVMDGNNLGKCIDLFEKGGGE